MSYKLSRYYFGEKTAAKFQGLSELSECIKVCKHFQIYLQTFLTD